jgi:hypothetical protein
MYNITLHLSSFEKTSDILYNAAYYGQRKFACSVLRDRQQNQSGPLDFDQLYPTVLAHIGLSLSKI